MASLRDRALYHSHPPGQGGRESDGLVRWQTAGRQQQAVSSPGQGRPAVGTVGTISTLP